MVRLLEISDANRSIAWGQDKKARKRLIGHGAQVARKKSLSPCPCHNVPLVLQHSRHRNPRSPAPLRDRQAERGFTLVELIMVIVIMGVLAVYAAPRMFDSADMYARGFHDETLAYLRFAQKTAVAQRRTVCVAFGGNSLTLTIASAAATLNCAAAGTLSGPKGTTPVVLNARSGSGVAYATPPALIDFNFNGLGQPITGLGVAMATQTIQVAGVSRSITVEAATGYVHE